MAKKGIRIEGVWARGCDDKANLGNKSAQVDDAKERASNERHATWPFGNDENFFKSIL